MSEEPVEYRIRDSIRLAPQERREVSFYGDVLVVVLIHHVPYVALRPIVDVLGIDWASQYQRLQRDDILNEEKRLVVMAGADGKQRAMVALPLEMLPGWIFGISGSRFKKPEMAAKLRLYRKECFRVLWHALGQHDLGSTSLGQTTPSGRGSTPGNTEL